MACPISQFKRTSTTPNMMNARYDPLQLVPGSPWVKLIYKHIYDSGEKTSAVPDRFAATITVSLDLERHDTSDRQTCRNADRHETPSKRRTIELKRYSMWLTQRGKNVRRNTTWPRTLVTRYGCPQNTRVLCVDYVGKCTPEGLLRFVCGPRRTEG